MPAVQIDDGTGEIITVPGFGVAMGGGTTVPSDGALGWSHGAIFIKYNGTAYSDGAYVNIGTKSSANFDPIYAAAATTTGNWEMPMQDWWVWDAVATHIPATPGTDDLGLSTATWLSGIPLYLRTVDFGGTTTTAYARRQLNLPSDYVMGTNLTINVIAGMENVADTSCTVDLEATCPTGDPTSDGITTAAQSINTAHGGTAGATKSFTLSGSIFGNPGDLIDLRLKVAGTDVGDATADIRANIQFLGLSYTRYVQ